MIQSPLPAKIKLAYWLWKQLGAYLARHIASRPDIPAVGIQIPGYLFLDGNWMPDRHASVQQ